MSSPFFVSQPESPVNYVQTVFDALPKDNNCVNELNYIIHFFQSAVSQQDMTMFYANKRSLKTGKHQLHFFFQPLKMKMEGEKFRSTFNENFKLVSVAWTKDRDNIIYVLRFDKRFALFCSGTKSVYEAFEIDLRDPLITDHIKIVYGGDDQNNVFYIYSVNWMKMLTMNKRDPHRYKVVTFNSKPESHVVDLSIFSNSLYVFSTSMTLRFTVGATNGPSRPLNIKSEYFGHFLAVMEQYNSSQNVKCLSSELENACFLGIEKFGFPLSVPKEKGNWNRIAMGPVMMEKVINSYLYLMCLSRDYCVLLRFYEDRAECLFEQKSEGSFMNVYYGFGMFYIIKAEEVIVYNTVNNQTFTLITKTDELQMLTSITDIKQGNGKMGILTIDTKDVELRMVKIGIDGFVQRISPMIDLTFLTRGFYPEGLLKNMRLLHIDFSVITKESVMLNILTDIGRRLLLDDNPLLETLVTKTVIDLDLKPIPFPTDLEKYSKSDFMNVFPYMKSVVGPNGVGKEEWKTRAVLVLQALLKAKGDKLRTLAESYLNVVETILSKIQDEFTKRIEGMTQQQKLFETVIFNGAMNGVMKEIGLEKEDGYCDINVQFFEKYPFDIIIQFVNVGILEFSMMEASTLLNRFNKESEIHKDANWKRRERKFLGERLGGAGAQSTLVALGINEGVRKVTYNGVGDRHFLVTESNPDILLIRKEVEEEKQKGRANDTNFMSKSLVPKFFKHNVQRMFD
ncbi:hypothetical protein EIN_176900 [Entamoeba invadens IP1]|uniref:hypothetical protein n=1 Tax=Entamoeba invadens IP1 TaxID=370355 RepID=UPI0002C3E2A6|nr:hypothetical protein EIN_176900 [Entamoeba invadens IP1]ELP93863.1 hypothetical protein EIN_176900 [Entamoeba invadens IP1]|eukprot:XP_004260634.1 hypothetical protein EIN_176900 [Entamoeba invadens IP1]